MNKTSLTNLVVDLAVRAGKILASSYKNEIDGIASKGTDQNLVTKMDREIEGMIVNELKAITPEANFVGEELGEIRNDSSITWIIDPIDGTRYFAKNLPLFSLTIAQLEHDIPQLGVIHFPVSGQTFYGIKGYGAYLDGKQIYASKVLNLRDAIIHVDTDSLQKLSPDESNWFYQRITKLLRSSYRVRMFGSSSLAAACLATGAINGFVDLTGYNPAWDLAALQLIVSEAGARCDYVDVGIGPRRFLATNTELWDQVLAILMLGNQ